jgi:beta-galactosidase/beta-glucuronidase
VLPFLLNPRPAPCQDNRAAPLPPGIAAVWDAAQAERESTPTRERICINGLWRWQPAREPAHRPPEDRWGHFKVPGCWPGITDYMQKDCQTVFAHPGWKDERLGNITAAWYQREITVPREWSGRRIALTVECLNSLATVYVDDKAAGVLRFPGGELDLTPLCRPGGTHLLSLHVAALPLKGVMLSYNDTNAAREVQGRVARRGLCGDVYLVSAPSGPRLADVKVDTSVRRQDVTFDVALEQLADDAQYLLRARVVPAGSTHRLAAGEDREVAEFRSPAFAARDLREGRVAFTQPWAPDRLWDLHTPQHTYQVTVSLEDAAGKVLDTSLRERFGAREFWIDGRDFYLNGTRLFLSAVPFDNAQIGAAWADYAGARESLLRLKSFGINFVYTHNYGCEPGSHLGFHEILTAADDVGMLVALSQPHFSHYDWQADDADESNGYARHAKSYVRTAQNHPSVVAYSMSHNACGYGEDMNPDMIDGLREPRSTSYELNNSRRALRAEAIVRRLDPGRIVYHHAGGHIGSMHTMNFYPNFVPIQELSDWFGHWATEGVKPAFMCEYGAPFSWDWAMYRGWYKGEREFGSARVPWEFCLAEWNAQFHGDRAFDTSEFEKQNLRWEAGQLRAGKLWQRWDYPHNLNSKLFEERHAVIARYLTDNWRAFRTWGVSAITPWEHGQYWSLRDGVDRGRKALPVDWQHLQRPGFSPDYTEQRYERMDLAYERSDWEPTQAAAALLRNNGPLLGWIAGAPAAFTSKDHLFRPGETVEKQLVVINNSREPVTCDCDWSLGLPAPVAGRQQVTVSTGAQERVPLEFRLPEALAPGAYELRAGFKFSTGEMQDDIFRIQVLPPPAVPAAADIRLALWDPPGQTRALLDRVGVRYRPVEADADLSGFDLLVVGKSALTLAGPAPDIARVRDGLRVLLFEQTADVMEQRLGFRVAEYGLRQVFPRVPDHPVFAGLETDHLRDWRGEATLLPPRLTYQMRPRHGPTVNWCDIPVPRLWRCGNRGNVASVLLEKPARGDFLPLVDGGYSLQYSPLLEHRDGQGLILFCQLDVTGRRAETRLLGETGFLDNDPAAETLARRLLQYVSAWKPSPRRTALYVGDPAGKDHLESIGVSARTYEGGRLSTDQVLVVGPGGGQALARDTDAVAEWLKAGGRLLAIGLDEQDARAIPLLQVRLQQAEHISATFDPPGALSLLAGVGPADVHNRDPRALSLVASGASVLGDGVLAQSQDPPVVFCQLAPWQFGGSPQPNLRKTYRRSSTLVSRLLANLGVAGPSPIAARFHAPVSADEPRKRWQDGLYLDQPEEWDDPYRFFRW